MFKWVDDEAAIHGPTYERGADVPTYICKPAMGLQGAGIKLVQVRLTPSTLPGCREANPGILLRMSCRCPAHKALRHSLSVVDADVGSGY
jgi:hypothetical protein